MDLWTDRDNRIEPERSGDKRKEVLKMLRSVSDLLLRRAWTAVLLCAVALFSLGQAYAKTVAKGEFTLRKAGIVK